MAPDKFEKTMEMLKTLTPEQVKAKLMELRGMCICLDCATYTKCAQDKDELLFCANGKSNGCMVERVGCVCPGCPVTEAVGCTMQYYCFEGTEAERRAKGK